MRVFVLEDDPVRIELFRKAGMEHDLTVVTTLSRPDGAFAQWNPPYDLVYLDHDLGGQIMVDWGKEETGAAFTRWLPPAGDHQPVITIHSHNPVGTQRMFWDLRDRGYTRVLIFPFGPTILETLQRSTDLPSWRVDRHRRL
mgnify:CR=1 FL=1